MALDNLTIRNELRETWEKITHVLAKTEVVDNSRDVALLSLIVIVIQSSSFVFVWLCIVLRCWLLLLFG